MKSGLIAATFTPRPICRGLVPPVVVRRRGADALRLQELRGKQHVGFLETDRVRVGDVVAHDVDRRFGGLQAGERRRHCRLKTHGILSLFRNELLAMGGSPLVKAV